MGLQKHTLMRCRGTRDYGMFDVDFESNLVHTLRSVVVIAHSVVACSPARIASQCCHLMRVLLYYSLQTFYKYKSLITRPFESNASHRSVVILCVWICIAACKRFTNTKASSSLDQQRATHRIAVLSSYACWFVLQLANFLQIQKHHHSTNRAQHIAVKGAC